MEKPRVSSLASSPDFIVAYAIFLRGKPFHHLTFTTTYLSVSQLVVPGYLGDVHLSVHPLGLARLISGSREFHLLIKFGLTPSPPLSFLLTVPIFLLNYITSNLVFRLQYNTITVQMAIKRKGHSWWSPRTHQLFLLSCASCLVSLSPECNPCVFYCSPSHLSCMHPSILMHPSIALCPYPPNYRPK